MEESIKQIIVAFVVMILLGMSLFSHAVRDSAERMSFLPEDSTAPEMPDRSTLNPSEEVPSEEMPSEEMPAEEMTSEMIYTIALQAVLNEMRKITLSSEESGNAFEISGAYRTDEFFSVDFHQLYNWTDEITALSRTESGTLSACFDGSGRGEFQTVSTSNDEQFSYRILGFQMNRAAPSDDYAPVTEICRYYDRDHSCKYVHTLYEQKNAGWYYEKYDTAFDWDVVAAALSYASIFTDCKMTKKDSSFVLEPVLKLDANGVEAINTLIHPLYAREYEWQQTEVKIQISKEGRFEQIDFCIQGVPKPGEEKAGFTENTFKGAVSLEHITIDFSLSFQYETDYSYHLPEKAVLWSVPAEEFKPFQYIESENPWKDDVFDCNHQVLFDQESYSFAVDHLEDDAHLGLVIFFEMSNRTDQPVYFKINDMSVNGKDVFFVDTVMAVLENSSQITSVHLPKSYIIRPGFDLTETDVVHIDSISFTLSLKDSIAAIYGPGIFTQRYTVTLGEKK